jgi:hypothetical protein
MNDQPHDNAVNDVSNELGKACHRTSLMIARNRMVLHDRNADEQHHHDAVDAPCHSKSPPDKGYSHQEQDSPVKIGKDDARGEMDEIADGKRVLRSPGDEGSDRRNDIDLAEANPARQRKKRAHDSGPHNSSDQGSQGGKHIATLA